MSTATAGGAGQRASYTATNMLIPHALGGTTFSLCEDQPFSGGTKKTVERRARSSVLLGFIFSWV
jgi:hypothetical protein